MGGATCGSQRCCGVAIRSMLQQHHVNDVIFPLARSAAPVLGSDNLVHFDTVNVSKVVIRLSMHTNSSLPPDLKQIKQSLVIPIVKFEAPLVLGQSNSDAHTHPHCWSTIPSHTLLPVSFFLLLLPSTAKYHQRHLSGARQIVLDSVISHYKKVCCDVHTHTRARACVCMRAQYCQSLHLTHTLFAHTPSTLPTPPPAHAPPLHTNRPSRANLSRSLAQ